MRQCAHTHRSLIVFLVALLAPALALAQETQPGWYAFDMGEMDDGAGNSRVHAITGQQFVGTASQDATQLLSGFLSDTLLIETPTAVVERPFSPRSFDLDQNFPNPFNPATKISFTIRDAGFISLKVYDLLGREVAVLAEEEKTPGTYTVSWDAKGIPSGAYFYRLLAQRRTGDRERFSRIGKMLLLR